MGPATRGIPPEPEVSSHGDKPLQGNVQRVESRSPPHHVDRFQLPITLTARPHQHARISSRTVDRSIVTPRTELDTRFSDPEAQPTSWEDTLDAIKQADLFWISTVRADGRPHVTPLLAVWLHDALHFSTGAEEQKALNLAGNPRVALTTGSNGWQRGLDLVVEGQAVRVTDPEQLQQLAVAWAQKWDGRWQYSVVENGFRHEGGTALVFAVRPTKVIAFAKGRFGHTRYRF